MAEAAPTTHFFPPALGMFSQGWLLMLARGIAAIVFALWTLAFPGFGLVALVLLFGMYAVFDGALALALAIGDGEGVRDRWWYALGGLVSLVAGFAVFIWPLGASAILLSFIGIWAVVRGVTEILAGIALRKQIANEWELIGGGAATIVFGLALLAYPGIAALALMLMIGAWGLFLGVLMVVLAFRLRNLASA